MPRFTGYPANWDLMSALEKIEWVKSNFPGITNEVPKMTNHIVNVGNTMEPAKQAAGSFLNRLEPVKQAVANVPKYHGQTASEIYAQHLLDKQKAAQNASAGAAGIGAGLKGLAGMKMGATASFGVPLAAGAIGALAIRNAKKKFDKETDAGVRDTMKRGDELIAATRKAREKKNKLSK